MGRLAVLRARGEVGDQPQSALDLPHALAVYQQLRHADRVGFLGDAEEADTYLAQWLDADQALSPARLWTDAWLAASAEAAGLRLVSFDADFRRFALQRFLQLSIDAG